MKYFSCHASASYVGTDETWKIKAVTEEEAKKIFTPTAIEHIDTYEDMYEDQDSGMEREYDFHLDELTEEEFNKLNVEELT